MDITSTSFTVADYCSAMARSEIVVNRQYQRSDKVWPTPAQSFLIETILLGYPIPKLSLYQKTDLKSRKTIKEIVDGQQRSKTIKDFYDGKLALARNKCSINEVAGLTFDNLPAEFQHTFLDYSLSIDLFVSASSEEIREVFRRINSYTIPLNAEEQRHAEYQGAFKWFIYRLTHDLDTNLIDIGVFGEKQVIRMSDAKLLCEITSALIDGITTTDKKALDRLYSRFDPEGSFSQEDEIESRIKGAVNHLLELPDIHQTSLMKPYNFYSLALAIMHVSEPVEQLSLHFDAKTRGGLAPPDRSLPKLSQLAEALADPEEAERALKPFIDACTSRTNVKGQRITRFQWFCDAIAA